MSPGCLFMMLKANTAAPPRVAVDTDLLTPELDFLQV